MDHTQLGELYTVLISSAVGLIISLLGLGTAYLRKMGRKIEDEKLQASYNTTLGVVDDTLRAVLLEASENMKKKVADGTLTKEVRKMSNQLTWNVDLINVLERSKERLKKSPTLEKIVEYPTSGVYLEKDNLCVQDNYLFAASSYGLEIYEIEQDEQAQLISRLPLRDDARVVAVKNDYAYVQAVSFFENHTNLYKIDISDVSNPYVLDSVYTENEDGWGQGDIYNDFIIFRNHDLNNNFYYSIYKIPGFEFVQKYFCDNIFRQLNDSLALYRYNGNIFTLYSFCDPENISEIGQIDLSAGGISIDNIKTINDSILACLDSEGIAFWKYSNGRLSFNVMFSVVSRK